MDDAARLIAAGACPWFNLRIAKCGGVVNCLRIARLAGAVGIRFQIGCQVGETALLSAMGRHLAAHLAQAEFVEGSYGTALLQQDIADGVTFGRGGRADLIHGPGTGIAVREDIVRKFAVRSLVLGDLSP